jgi:hypothetical protein
LVFSKRKLSAREDFVVAFAAILMSTVGLALVAFVGHQCMCTGPAGLVRSTLVRKRRVCVAPTDVEATLPAEVTVPPRLELSEFGLEAD